MKRQLSNCDEAKTWWRYTVKHKGEEFIQVIERHPEMGGFDTWVGHVSYMREEDGGWHELLDVMRRSGEPYYNSLDNAIRAGNTLIKQWKPDDKAAHAPRSRKGK